MTNIVHIPSTAPFLDSLVSAILEGLLPFQKGQAPKVEELANITLLLPTRRACRVCGEAFLRLSNSKAIILPTIRPLGDGDDDEGLIYEALSSGFTGKGPDQSLIDMKPAVSSLERHLILTQAILSWRKNPELAPEPNLVKEQVEGQIKPAQASLMAHELAKLIDNAETEEVDLSNLENLVPDQFSEHWQHTLDFLTIITKVWPDYLKATDQLSQASRRNIMLNKETERLEQTKPENPIIIAGSTGSVPAAARLMKAVANLENGLIVLPGLDQDLDDLAFKNLVPYHPEHPQFGLSKLCTDIGEPRSNVKAVEGTEASSSEAALTRFISEALRPSSSTEQWQDYIKQYETAPEEKESLKAGFENISLNLARDAQEEAEMVSLILRRTAESKNQTAALVTPDRLLARRVAVRLEEWGIKVDDSGGRPLAKTMPGAFFDSIIQCQNSGFEPAFLLALLKHPLTRLGFERGDSRLAARALEISALRQPWMGRGLEGLRKTFETIKTQCCAGDGEEGNGKQADVHLHPAIKRLKEEEWALAEQLLERLEKAFAPLAELFKSAKDHNLQSFLDAHIYTAEHLAESFEERESCEAIQASEEEQDQKTDQVQEQEIGSQLWVGAAGEQLAKLCAEIISIKNVSPSLKARDYPEFYRSLIAGETVRPLTPVHPRIFIWGPFEARLQQTDVVILGGLNEGTWPNTANANPWLSRPMCQELGLPAPEQHIGYGAHDFASLLCAKEVYLTRASKTDGVQTVPSRWIMRMSALLDGLEASELLEPKTDEPFDQWAALRDKVEPAPKIKSPAPKPPVKARPRQLSVTRIEDWIANPYSIFARSILKLAPLDPLGAPPNAAMRGQIIHKAMQIFTERYPKSLPQNSEQELAEISAELMKEIANHPQIGTFWQPRFERFTKWFAETEPARRDELKQCHTELNGRLEVKAPAGPFYLTARADRIDEAKNGSFHIYDYKTGTVPSPAKVKALFSPQLPLEAAIQQEAGFKGLNKGEVTALSYIAAKGGSPAGIETTIDGDQMGELIEQSLKQLENLVGKFDKVETPYKALRRHDFKGQYEYDDYAHLARVQEWGAEDESEDK